MAQKKTPHKSAKKEDKKRKARDAEPEAQEGGVATEDDEEIAEPLAMASGIEVWCSHDAIIPLVKIIPNPRNPNQHPPEQIRLLSKIIKAHGWRDKITISKRSGFIVKGEGRYKAAQFLQVDEVPVEYQDYRSEAEEWADLVADNRIAELAEMSMPKLKEMLADFDDGFDMELAGFNDIDFKQLMDSFSPDDTHLPNGLPPPPVTGEDDSTGRFMLVFKTDDEKKFWCEKLGIPEDTHQVVWSVEDFEEEESDGDGEEA